jgi:hypothetical protein
MKKLLIFSFLLLSLSQARAQDGIVFKIKYLPGHSYQSAIKGTAKIAANVSGDQQMMGKLKTFGITNKADVDVDLSASGVTTTGTAASDNTFPLTTEYKVTNIALNLNGREFPLPPMITEKNMKMYAHASADGHIKMDSVAGKKANDTTQQKAQHMMDMFQNQVKFPDKPLKPGDTFTQSAPMTIPMKGNDIHVTGKVIYKLISISDGKAYFDLTPDISVDGKVHGLNVTIKGNGQGKMVYSIKDNFPLSKEGTINLTIKATSAQLNVDATAVINSSYSGTIN